MKLYNPSGWDAEFKACGDIYIVPAFDTIDILDLQSLRVILNANGHAHKDLGIVHLDYTPLLREKYATFKDFALAQAKVGLDNVRRYRKDAWVNERQAVADIKLKSGTEADKELVNTAPFKESLDKVDGWIEDLKSGKHPVFNLLDKFSDSGLAKVSLSDLSDDDRAHLERELKADSAAPKLRGRPPKRRIMNEPTGNKEPSSAQAG